MMMTQDTYSNIVGGYKKQFIDDILNGMTGLLDNKQLTELNHILNKHTMYLDFADNPKNYDINFEKSNKTLIKSFIKAKKLNGLSQKSIEYYESQLKKFNEWCIKAITELTGDDITEYLKYYQSRNNCSKTTLNNTRRIISSLYTWLTNEEYIIMNPMRQVPCIKTPKKVKKAFTTEEIELLRIELENKNEYSKKHRELTYWRNKTIFELLLSSGIRLSELSGLNIEDIDLNENQAIINGKGNKQRVVYFNDKTKIAIINYLKKRNDNNPALFISARHPDSRLKHNSIGNTIREIGDRAGVVNTHPHRFRRTFATNLIKKEMPITQVSKLLGHTTLNVTQLYIESDSEQLQMIHRKYTN